GDSLEERRDADDLAMILEERGGVGGLLVAADPTRVFRPAVPPLTGVAGPHRAMTVIETLSTRPQLVFTGGDNQRRCARHPPPIPALVDGDLVLDGDPFRTAVRQRLTAGDLRQRTEHGADDASRSVGIES